MFVYMSHLSQTMLREELHHHIQLYVALCVGSSKTYEERDMIAAFAITCVRLLNPNLRKFVSMIKI